MENRKRETIIGACVVLLGTAVLTLAYVGKSHASVDGYEVEARFNRAEGVSVGSDVRLSGVSVGKVVGQTLDDRFRAVLTFRIAPDVQIPSDSAALVQTDCLLGAKFVAIQVGGNDDMLKAGQAFAYTQDSVNVQDLLEQIIAQGQAKQARERQEAARLQQVQQQLQQQPAAQPPASQEAAPQGAP